MLDPTQSIETVALRGRRVLLEPLSASHRHGLAAAINDGQLWTIPVTLVPHPDDLGDFLTQAQTRHAAQLERQFATIDLDSGTVVGSTRFMNINRMHRRAEIGFTFIARSWQRSHVNTEAKYLMLRHAFETWGCVRVEFITDVLNEASRAAILRLGAKEEGIMRSHMIMRDGRRRDSVLHSVVESGWPDAKRRLEERMSAVADVMRQNPDRSSRTPPDKMPRQAIDFDAVRAIGAALPDVKDASGSRGMALRIKGKLLACAAIHKSAEPDSLMVRISLERREALLAQDAEAYYLTDHYAPYPAILVRLSRIKRASLKELLAESRGFVLESAR